MSLYFVYLFILPNISNPHTPTLERTNHNDWTRTNVTPMCGHNRHWKRKLDRTHSEAGRQKVIAGSGHKKCFPKMHCGWDGITNVSLSVRFSGKPPTRLLLKPDFKKNWLISCPLSKGCCQPQSRGHKKRKQQHADLRRDGVSTFHPAFYWQFIT